MEETINTAKLISLIDQAHSLTTECASISWNTKYEETVGRLIVELPELKADIESGKISNFYYAIFDKVIFDYVQGTAEFLQNIRSEVNRNSFSPADTIFWGEEFLRIRYLFSNLGYFNSNIVIVGANGSGKTILANTLKETIKSKSWVVIPAQKVMVIPSYNGTFSSATTQKNLEELQNKDRGVRITYDGTNENSIPYTYLKDIGNDFKIVLDNLLSENNELVHRRDATRKGGGEVDYTEKSKLDTTIEIWESLIKHRKIEFESGYKLKLSGENVGSYPLYNMSDGEKVALYNIAHVIQAPKDGIIVIDEPEMFLHKTITSQLWNKLEEVRNDCLFIYLTHDLEFAVGRTNSKKAWIKSFEYNNRLVHRHKWEIEELPETEIPQELLLRILGSGKTILFCEGKSTNSIDKQIFEIIFPNLTITPVESCKEVINYTKSYNKMPNVNTNAIGLIDLDHRDETQLPALKRNKVYTLPFAEIENLFFEEEFLKLFIEKYDDDKDILIKIKEDVIRTLSSKKELQVSNFVSSKINYFFSESHMDKANTKSKISSNFEDFKSKIDVETWYLDREVVVSKIITDNNYNEAIKVFNNKGLCSIANKFFKVSNFQERALKYLKSYKEPQEALLKCFPKEIHSNS